MAVGGLEMDARLVLVASDALVAGGDDVVAVAPPFDRPIPDVPEDRHGLRDSLLAFEAVRAAFDRRFSEGLQEAGARLTGAALDVLAVDGAPVPIPVPAAAIEPGMRRR